MTFDGKVAVWYHSLCFFGKQRQEQPKTCQIANFENISYTDQLKIIARIDPKEAEKFKEIARKRENEKEFSPGNFRADYAGTDKDPCSTCLFPIEHKEPRIRRTVYGGDSRFGKQILWAHMACFVFNRDRYHYPWDGKLMEGFESLQPEHQVFLDETLP
jgi:hypothetical protein